jgi:hypothetical protein
MAALTNIRRSSWVYILLSLSVFSVVRVTAGPPPVETIKFQAPDIFPGGFDWDDKHDRFLLGSTTFGSLFSLSLDGTLNEFVKDSDYAGKFAILGISVDGIHNRVVAVIQDLNFSAPVFSGIAAYDLDSNKRLFFTRLDTVVLKEGEKTLANDVAIDAMGNAYVTNSFGNYVWRVTKDGTAAVYAEDTILTTQPVVVNTSTDFYGLNGIVYHKNGFLLVVQTNSGALFKIDLNDAKVHNVIMRESLPSADGLVLRGDGTLVVVTREKVLLLGSASGWQAANVVGAVVLNSSDFVTSAAMRTSTRTYILPSYSSEIWGGMSRTNFEVREIQFSEEWQEDTPIWLIVVIVVAVLVVTAWRFQMAYFYKQYRRKRA